MSEINVWSVIKIPQHDLKFSVEISSIKEVLSNVIDVVVICVVTNICVVSFSTKPKTHKWRWTVIS